MMQQQKRLWNSKKKGKSARMHFKHLGKAQQRQVVIILDICLIFDSALGKPCNISDTVKVH